MLERSFHSVGLIQILKAVTVPKGSFYHYFESNEHFGVEMLKHYVAEATADKRAGIQRPLPEDDQACDRDSPDLRGGGAPPEHRLVRRGESAVGPHARGERCPLPGHGSTRPGLTAPGQCDNHW